jgi:predicted nucleic acid-binding protein
MSLTVFLDAGPLGLVTNPKRTPETIAAAQWIYNMEAAGHRFLVPAIADYEVRRELVRSGKTRGIARLDAFNAAEAGRFLSLTNAALLRGADLWAQARNAGTPTADPKELDADVLIAAQALDMGLPTSDFVIATVNVGHLALFVPPDHWTNINP